MRELDKDHLRLATLNALANWAKYQTEYEFFIDGGDWKKRPLFKFKNFHSFCNDYGLSRNIRHKDNVGKSATDFPDAQKRQNAENARQALCKLLKGLDPDRRTDVRSLSETLGEWAKSPNCVLDGPKKGKPFLVSLCSKVMSFVDPAQFPPFDRLGRRGVYKVAGNPSAKLESDSWIPYNSYGDYKKDFDRVFNKLGVQKEIDAELELHSIFKRPRQRLMPRVLDNYFMIVGAFQ